MAHDGHTSDTNTTSSTHTHRNFDALIDQHRRTWEVKADPGSTLLKPPLSLPWDKYVMRVGNLTGGGFLPSWVGPIQYICEPMTVSHAPRLPHRMQCPTWHTAFLTSWVECECLDDGACLSRICFCMRHCAFMPPGLR